MKHIFLIGFMGSGKSRIGKALANKLGLQFVDTDEYIEDQYAMSIAKIFDIKGEKAFRRSELEFLKNFNEEEVHVVSTGGGMPCNDLCMDLIKQKSISFYLYMPTEELVDRLMGSQTGRPLLSQLSNSSELNSYVKDLLMKREKFYFQANYICEARKELDEICEDIIELLSLHE